MSNKMCQKQTKQFLYVVWNILCFHTSTTTSPAFYKALGMFSPHVLAFQALPQSASTTVVVDTLLFSNLISQLTQYQCRSICYHSLWNNLLGVERCATLVSNLKTSVDTFIASFIPMRLNSVELKYRFNKIKPIFHAWRQHYDWTVRIRRILKYAEDAKRRKALCHFHAMTRKYVAAREYYSTTHPVANLKWLSLLFHRFSRITKRLRGYKIVKLEKMALLLFSKIHVPTCFDWWVDVVDELNKMPRAVQQNNASITKHWFQRYKMYVLKLVKDKKVDAMRLAFHQQDMDELQRVDDQNVYFLSQQELKKREERYSFNIGYVYFNCVLPADVT